MLMWGATNIAVVLYCVFLLWFMQLELVGGGNSTAGAATGTRLNAH